MSVPATGSPPDLAPEATLISQTDIITSLSLKLKLETTGNTNIKNLYNIAETNSNIKTMMQFANMQRPMIDVCAPGLQERDVVIDIMDDFDLPRCNSPTAFENDYDGGSKMFLNNSSSPPALFDGFKDFISSKISSSMETGVFKSVFPPAPYFSISDVSKNSCSQVV